MISPEASAIIVTRGKRFGAQPLDTGGRKHVIIDVEHLQDPARDPAMTVHVGWVAGISGSLIGAPEFVNVLSSIKALVGDCDNSEGILIEIRCKSGMRALDFVRCSR